MKKRIGIITTNVEAAQTYKKVLDALLGDIVDIVTYSIEDDSVFAIQPCNVFLVSSTSFNAGQHVDFLDLIPKEALIVKTEVTFTEEAIRQLRGFPKGTKALMANQNQHMALESISQLYHLGVSNITFQPYYPGSGEAPEVDVVVACGELRYVPANAMKVINLGCRTLTSNTVSEIALKLGVPAFLESETFKNYMMSLASADYSLKELSISNLTLENKLEIIINALDSGVMVFDENGIISIANSVAENLFKMNRGELAGSQISDLLPAIALEQCRKAKAAQEPRLIKLKGTNINLTMTPIYVKDQYIGTCAIVQKFEDSEHRQNSLRRQMLERGHRAKYTFEDIIGESPSLRKACDIARRMAGTDASVILEGDSGTGKEMFAQAIHNASPRSGEPFIALNCAALPETLLESELFGYEEGAFTDAKKGGKVGLFEFAHQGTIFLDEIENMSPALQAKLLRVLQEKEVTRIGASRSVIVDVRLISASNCDLFAMMKRGNFRKDLYYRICVMPIHIPPLRERGEDVLLLADYFQKKLNASFEFTPAAREALLRHEWDGNVRELRNYIEYLKYMGLEMVDLEDLPAALQHHGGTKGAKEAAAQVDPAAQTQSSDITEKEWLILQAIRQAGVAGKGAGRQAINLYSLQRGCPLSDHEIRWGMNTLRQKGYIQVVKGRGGSRLTPEGANRLKTGR